MLPHAARPSGCERDQRVNSAGSRNRGFQEFWRVFSGSERYLHGPPRTPSTLSRNGESATEAGDGENATDIGVKRETPRDLLSASAGNSCVVWRSILCRKLPERDPLRNNTRDFLTPQFLVRTVLGATLLGT